MAKDRAKPFSRKHRKYWIPVTGGMILIGIINVAIGYCTYTPVGDPPERIVPSLPPDTASDGTISGADIPVAVMRTFTTRYPRNVPKARKLATPDGTLYEMAFTRDGKPGTATFREDGTFVKEQ